MLLWLLIFCALTRGAATPCAQQLHNIYVSLGMNASYPVLPVLTFTTGNVALHNYTEVDILFQQVARAYETQLPPHGALGVPYVSYVSMDLPWCATTIQASSCAAVTIEGLGKSYKCPTLPDFDVGGATQLAGRLWIYPNQTNPDCLNGTEALSVRIFNTTFTPASETSIYTYATGGLYAPNGEAYMYLQPEVEAERAYQFAPCNEVTGEDINATILVDDQQMVCSASLIGCALQRTAGVLPSEVQPVPFYSCIGNVTPGGPVVQVWRVDSFQEVSEVDTTFSLAFCATTNEVCVDDFKIGVSLGTAPVYTLQSGTRRQFIADFTDFAYQCILYWNGHFVGFAPFYYLAPRDDVLRNIPCICGFSMDCLPTGEVAGDNTPVSAFMYLGNTIPLPNPGPSIEIPQKTNWVVLNATESQDPDHRPGPTTYYWAVYEVPGEAEAPDIEVPTEPVVFVPAEMFETGLYVFTLYT